MLTACEIVDWAVSSWTAKVKNRPLQNDHRRALDTKWRQLIAILAATMSVYAVRATMNWWRPTVRLRPEGKAVACQPKFMMVISTGGSIAARACLHAVRSGGSRRV